jgi:Phage derived protein Gp49-like (DUF891)
MRKPPQDSDLNRAAARRGASTPEHPALRCRSEPGQRLKAITGSKIKNLKELRPGSSGRSEIRVLFVFDSWRSAILLVAGDNGSPLGHIGVQVLRDAQRGSTYVWGGGSPEQAPAGRSTWPFRALGWRA